MKVGESGSDVSLVRRMRNRCKTQIQNIYSLSSLPLHSSAAAQSDLRVPCWRCCGWKEQRGRAQCKPASSLPGWTLPRPQTGPANPARLPGASLSQQDEATNTQIAHRAGVSAFALSIGFKAPILPCCQNMSLSFFPTVVGWTLLAGIHH